MEYSFIIAVIPIILVVAFIVWIANKISAGERLDMKEGVVGVVILLVAVLVMVPMVSSTQVYMWDPDSGELTIQQNISGGAYAWDTYDEQIKSIVIKPGVTQIGNSAFDGATNLEYLSIPESVIDIGTNAFGTTFVDPFGTSIDNADLPGHEFAGESGQLCLCDPSIFSYASSNAIIGLSTYGTNAKYLVLPRLNDSRPVENVGANAFSGNTNILGVYSVPDGSIKTFQGRVFEGCISLETFIIPDSTVSTGGYMFNGDTALARADLSSKMTATAIHTFRGCTSLASVTLPEGLQTIGSFTFGDCSALQSIEFPTGVTDIASNAFINCSSIAAIDIPAGIRTLGDHTFDGCTGMASIDLPASMTTIGAGCFIGCTGLTAISFGAGFAATLGNNWASSWTFYASDGTTTIEKTAANLAGKAFQGTAAALIEVAPGQLALTPQQIQQVHLHDAELQDLKDHLTIDPLPFQPSVQTEDPVAA